MSVNSSSLLCIVNQTCEATLMKFSFFKILLWSLVLGMGHVAHAEWCLPKSKLRYPVHQKALGMDEVQFQKLLDKFSAGLQLPSENKAGQKIKVSGDWANAEVNAHATLDEDGTPKIIITGGMARHPEMNNDGLAFIFCHEAGHPFGGAPKQLRGQSQLRSWSSAEGQADYFAATKCLPTLFSDETENALALVLYPKEWVESARKKCKDARDTNENLCARIILSGLTAGRVFASLKNSFKMPNLDDNDSGVVGVTKYGHPRPQCRVDTVIAGANCEVAKEISFDVKDAKIGACGHIQGARPACWFNPEFY